jgi:ribosomal protein S18 acetylase RimI-like enzyme
MSSVPAHGAAGGVHPGFEQAEIPMTITTRFATEADRAAWERVFLAYATFGKTEQTPQMRVRVWGWIMTPTAQTRCIVAEAEAGELVGFTHFRSYERPLPATIGAYIDDMFVDPSLRGQGVVDLMIRAVGDFAESQGWDVVRWMTREKNYRARAVYDRHADKTD